MPWNWELPKWPAFSYHSESIALQERQFLLGAGSVGAYLKKLDGNEHIQFVVEILSIEGQKSSKIEGESLDRESLQSSIKKHFGLIGPSKKLPQKEKGMAELLCDVYESFQKPLSYSMFWSWHAKLFESPGEYRSHTEPMQIVSNRLDRPQVFFEAPPSQSIHHEMGRFIAWFNATPNIRQSILGRAAIAHVYFESIHPFEDGNGRIGRILIEKSLSQGIGRPILIATSKIFEKRKKEYYAALERCNETLEVTAWVAFFADVILQAQEESLQWLHFILEKSHLFTRLRDQLNPRQEKVLLRMFEEGPSGFQGGLSAEKYIAITSTSRATATRDLAELVHAQALIKTGELRHTRYWLNRPLA